MDYDSRMHILTLLNVGTRRCLTLLKTYRGGKHGHTHTWMEILNPSTSANLAMTKHQHLFLALVNMDIFQITLKLSLLTADF